MENSIPFPPNDEGAIESCPYAPNDEGVIEPSGDIEDMYSYFEENEDQLEQVLCLKIRTNMFDSRHSCYSFLKNDMLDIPGHFPYLKELTLDNDHGGYGPDDDDSDIEEDNYRSTYEDLVDQETAKEWTGITKFKELNQFSLSTALLKKGGFVNLLELDVDFLRHAYDGFELLPETEPRKLILQLSNAPLLKTLKLRNGRMNLADWENIACNAPQLEVLRFDDMIIERPYIQKSTTSKLKKFHASNCSKQSNELILLGLVDKYKTLETLEIHRVENEKDDGDGCLHLKKHLNCLLATIVSQNPALKTYVIDLSPESYELKKVCSQDVSECEETLRIAIESLTAEPEYEPNSTEGVRRTKFNISNA